VRLGLQAIATADAAQPLLDVLEAKFAWRIGCSCSDSPTEPHRRGLGPALNMRNNGNMSALTTISLVGIVLVFVLVFLLLSYFR
jgi:hypothetical protein